MIRNLSVKLLKSRIVRGMRRAKTVTNMHEQNKKVSAKSLHFKTRANSDGFILLSRVNTGFMRISVADGKPHK